MKIQILGPPYKFWINQTSSYFIGVEGTDMTVGSHIIKCSAFFGYLGVTLSKVDRTDENTINKIKQGKIVIEQVNSAL